MGEKGAKHLKPNDSKGFSVTYWNAYILCEKVTGGDQ